MNQYWISNHMNQYWVNLPFWFCDQLIIRWSVIHSTGDVPYVTLKAVRFWFGRFWFRSGSGVSGARHFVRRHEAGVSQRSQCHPATRTNGQPGDAAVIEPQTQPALRRKLQSSVTHTHTQRGSNKPAHTGNTEYSKRISQGVDHFTQNWQKQNTAVSWII